MTIDLDTFLVALYTIVDDLYQQHFAQFKPHRPGQHPHMSDSEVLTLALMAPAKAEDLWLAEAFFCWRTNPQGWPLDPDDLPRRHNGQEYVGPTGPLWPRSGVGEVSALPGRQWVLRGPVAESLAPGLRRHRDYGAVVLTPRNYSGDTARGLSKQHHRRRQIVETINGRLEGTFNLNFPQARTTWGLLSRVAAKVCALNLGIWLNRSFGRDGLAFATLFSC